MAGVTFAAESADVRNVWRKPIQKDRVPNARGASCGRQLAPLVPIVSFTSSRRLRRRGTTRPCCKSSLPGRRRTLQWLALRFDTARGWRLCAPSPRQIRQTCQLPAALRRSSSAWFRPSLGHAAKVYKNIEADAKAAPGRCPHLYWQRALAAAALCALVGSAGQGGRFVLRRAAHCRLLFP